MNDQTAAELILRSLDEPLSPQELSELESHLSGSEQSQRFAELSQRIQAAVAESRNVETSSQQGPGLSDLAKARLSRELRNALAAQMPLASRNPGVGDSGGFDEKSHKRMVAEPETDYRDDDQADTSNDAAN